MTVKDIKEFLSLYKDETPIVIKGASGISWEIRKDMIALKTIDDKKREVCKLYIK